MTTLIDRSLLDSLSAEAELAPRLRKHRNFHPGDTYPAHRLLVAIEPGSYVAPHRHLDPNKDETLLVVRGRLGVIIFGAENAVDRSIELQAGGEIAETERAPWAPVEGAPAAVDYLAGLRMLFP